MIDQQDTSSATSCAACGPTVVCCRCIQAHLQRVVLLADGCQVEVFQASAPPRAGKPPGGQMYGDDDDEDGSTESDEDDDDDDDDASGGAIEG